MDITNNEKNFQDENRVKYENSSEQIFEESNEIRINENIYDEFNVEQNRRVKKSQMQID